MQQKITVCCIKGYSMTDVENDNALMVKSKTTGIRIKSAEVSAIQEAMTA